MHTAKKAPNVSRSIVIIANNHVKLYLIHLSGENPRRLDRTLEVRAEDLVHVGTGVDQNVGGLPGLPLSFLGQVDVGPAQKPVVSFCFFHKKGI